ncbi:hypothetical protein JOM56_014330 [Amanita muscaria]
MAHRSAKSESSGGHYDIARRTPESFSSLMRCTAGERCCGASVCRMQCLGDEVREKQRSCELVNGDSTQGHENRHDLAGSNITAPRLVPIQSKNITESDYYYGYGYLCPYFAVHYTADVGGRLGTAVVTLSRVVDLKRQRGGRGHEEKRRRLVHQPRTAKRPPFSIAANNIAMKCLDRTDEAEYTLVLS